MNSTPPLVFFGLLLLSGVAAGQPLEPVAPINEYFHDSVTPAGGGVRAGLMVVDDAFPIHPGQLWVYVPQSSQRLLCVNIRSRDGQYEADAIYSTGTSLGRAIELHYRTRYPKLLSQFKPSQLAILSQVSDSCTSDRTGPFVISTWNPPASFSTVSLYLNARVDDVRVSYSSSPEILCRRANGTSLTAYDTECSLPRNAMTDRISLRIVRYDLGQPFPAIFMDVSLFVLPVRR